MRIPQFTGTLLSSKEMDASAMRESLSDPSANLQCLIEAFIPRSLLTQPHHPHNCQRVRRPVHTRLQQVIETQRIILARHLLQHHWTADNSLRIICCMANTLRLDLNDIRSVTDFQRNAKVHVARLKKTKAPMVLTVNGSAAIVVQDASAYQKLQNRIEELESEREFVAAVRVGLADVEAGRIQPALAALKTLGRKVGL
jgi:PHD/YefM family antitoxin component YafN of YafNO toxin-antitoxin module